MRWGVVLLALIAAVRAGERNPVRPAAARLLADPATCRQVAHDIAGRLRPTGKGDVYAGDAGIAIFLARTGKFNAEAEQYAQRALGLVTSRRGLYTGREGVGEACLEVWRATGKKEWLDRARSCAFLGSDYDYTVTDIISGAAGIGIFLLNLHQATGDARYLDEARRAGNYIASLMRPDGGVPMGSGPSRVYTGFSHGAAGAGYYLWHLGRRTGDAGYTALARQAAKFVLAHAEKEGRDGYHWWRTVPPQKGETRRVQWCHGAPGTGLFFLSLGDREALARCLNTTRRLGRTVRRSGCQCHGVAGNAELFVQAYPVLKEKWLLDEARRFASALVEPHADGFRLRPEGNDSSYMTGLAGIGQFFLGLADPAHALMPLMVRPEEKR